MDTISCRKLLLLGLSQTCTKLMLDKLEVFVLISFQRKISVL